MGKKVGSERYVGGSGVCPLNWGMLFQLTAPSSWVSWECSRGWNSLCLGELGEKVRSTEMSPGCPVLVCGVMEGRA